MRRAKELLGMPIISRTKGEIIGEVDDILFDSLSGELKILIIKNVEKSYTKIDNIYKIGEDLIVIEDRNLLYSESLDEVEKLASLNSGQNTILGEEVITSDGKEIGAVKDIVIDEKNYKMAGYEISGGIFNDLLKGRNILPMDNNYVQGEDAVILEDNDLKEI